MTILAIEGLGGSIGQWVRRGLRARAIPSEGIALVSWPWTYRANLSPFTQEIIVAHSFGVRLALAQAALDKPKLLLLLDPRMPPWGTGSGIVAPQGVRTVCIWRRGWMRGYPCEGAENIELHDGTSHLGVPFSEKAWEILRGAL